jgi:hypothetical protein
MSLFRNNGTLTQASTPPISKGPANKRMPRRINSDKVHLKREACANGVQSSACNSLRLHPQSQPAIQAHALPNSLQYQKCSIVQLQSASQINPLYNISINFNNFTATF